KHGTATLFRQGDLGSPKSETAREKTNAEHQRSRNIQPSRVRTGLWVSVKIQIGKDKRGEESRFGNNEAQNPYFVVIRKGYSCVVLTNYRVGPIRISDVPERPTAADRRQCNKVFMRRR